MARAFSPRRLFTRSASRTDEGGRARSLWRWAIAPVSVLVVLMLVGALDIARHNGEVLRNVDLAGVAIGGQSDGDLQATLRELDARLATVPVVLRNGDQSVET